MKKITANTEYCYYSFDIEDDFLIFKRYSKATGGIYGKKAITDLYNFLEDVFLVRGKFRTECNMDLIHVVFSEYLRDALRKYSNLDVSVLANFINRNPYIRISDLYGAHKVLWECSHEYGFKKALFYLQKYLTLKQGESIMSLPKVIIEHFPNTKDAVLVNKWFGQELENNKLMGMLLKDKEDSIIKEAQKLENAEAKKNI